ncbi:MAG: hypothetical protein OXF02_06625 [Simkaniaceae bacterium]|nr:hypothetical protein [Simkaniaceae bacterium]
MSCFSFLCCRRSSVARPPIDYEQGVRVILLSPEETRRIAKKVTGAVQEVLGTDAEVTTLTLVPATQARILVQRTEQTGVGGSTSSIPATAVPKDDSALHDGKPDAVTKADSPLTPTPVPGPVPVHGGSHALPTGGEIMHDEEEVKIEFGDNPAVAIVKMAALLYEDYEGGAFGKPGV